MNLALRVCAAAALALTLGLAQATPVISFNEATGNNGGQADQSVGWQFDVITPFTVTGLGWFDEGQNGLSVRHQVGIWNPAGVLLASVTLGAGTVEALDGQYRTQSIAPLVLAAGTGYIVGGLNSAASTDRLAFDVSMTVNPAINFVDATFSSNTSGLFERPTLFSVAVNGFFGPMFSGQAGAVVPEPSSFALAGLALLLAARSRRRAD